MGIGMIRHGRPNMELAARIADAARDVRARQRPEPAVGSDTEQADDRRPHEPSSTRKH